jgi:microcystin-dependent protein
MSEPYIGQIQAFGFDFAPRGWALCNGQLMSIAHNTALFSLIGTTYGGDGVTTFALPDLRGRAPTHWGQGPGLSDYEMGEMYGQQTHTLISTEMPAHNHILMANAGTADASDQPANNLLCQAHDASTGSGINVYSPHANTTMSPMAISVSGGSQPHNIQGPRLTISFCIALEGIFPSRG